MMCSTQLIVMHAQPTNLHCPYVLFVGTARSYCPASNPPCVGASKHIAILCSIIRDRTHMRVVIQRRLCTYIRCSKACERVAARGKAKNGVARAWQPRGFVSSGRLGFVYCHGICARLLQGLPHQLELVAPQGSCQADKDLLLIDGLHRKVPGDGWN